MLEKDINLAISKKLQTNLEQGGAFVVTSRVSDIALSDGKRKDLDSRRDLSNEFGVDILVSIHQNSYTSKSVKGAQVFYYNDSNNSKVLAECIQAQLVGFLDPDNKRVAKANEDYYMLKKTSVPAVIVECGFLSNESESISLTQDVYQEKVAWAIYMGIIDYFNQ